MLVQVQPWSGTLGSSGQADNKTWTICPIHSKQYAPSTVNCMPHPQWTIFLIHGKLCPIHGEQHAQWWSALADNSPIHTTRFSSLQSSLPQVSGIHSSSYTVYYCTSCVLSYIALFMSYVHTVHTVCAYVLYVFTLTSVMTLQKLSKDIDQMNFLRHC